MLNRKALLTLCCLFAASVLLVAAGVVTSVPKKLVRTGDKWKEGGRIVGEITGFKGKISIEVLNGKNGASVSKVEVIPGMTVYFTPVLKPGEYDLLIRPDGLPEAKVKQANVDKGADTLINLKF